jgi:hypothetical protein
MWLLALTPRLTAWPTLSFGITLSRDLVGLTERLLVLALCWVLVALTEVLLIRLEQDEGLSKFAAEGDRLLCGDHARIMERSVLWGGRGLDVAP